MSETRQCPNCGLDNDISRSLCQNCLTPLTAYAGQLTGEEEKGNLAAQVEKLEVRPPVVTALAIFEVFFAIFWPFAFVVGSFAARQGVNAEGTNYLAAAFGSIGPIFWAVVLIPFGVALCILAAFTWTQRTFTWTTNIGVLGLFGLFFLFKFTSSPIIAIFGLAIVGVLAFLWLRSDTKGWYGLD